MEQSSSEGQAQAGWYPDPHDPSSQRYWDGSRWTDQRTPAQAGGQAVAQPSTNGKAIASLVLGILWICGIGSILALVFGYQGKNEVDESGGTQGGRGLAIAGIVLGWIGVGSILLWLLLWALGAATLDITTS